LPGDLLPGTFLYQPDYRRISMKLTIIMLLILGLFTMASGETYRWVSDQGVIGYTDDPSRIPSRVPDTVTSRTPAERLSRQKLADESTRKRPRLQKRSKAQKMNQKAEKTASQVRATPAKVPQKPLPLAFQAEVKGHLGGDQKDPAPPSMKQPKPLPMGPQPPPTSPGMVQPEPLPMGPQPPPTSPGMKQPKPLPMGPQPPPTSSGMEQPDSKL
jgi:Domain of unknown function (DUF4124)